MLCAFGVLAARMIVELLHRCTPGPITNFKFSALCNDLIFGKLIMFQKRSVALNRVRYSSKTIVCRTEVVLDESGMSQL